MKYVDSVLSLEQWEEKELDEILNYEFKVPTSNFNEEILYFYPTDETESKIFRKYEYLNN